MLSHWVRVYKAVHTWTGILTGMALFIAFYAGALTVFKVPLERWASAPVSHSYQVALSDTPRLITQTLERDRSVGDEFFIHLQAQENHPATMAWTVAPEESDEHDQLSLQHYRSSFNEEGEVVIAQLTSSPLAQFIDVLHRVVGLPFDTEYTRWVMGVVAVLYALALFSGLVVVLPTIAKDLLSFRLGRNRKRMWLDAHNVVGIISLPFHLIIALTAIGFAFHDGIYSVQDKLVHKDGLAAEFRAAMPPPGPAPKDPGAMLAPEELVARVLDMAPGFEPTMLQYLRVDSPRPMVRVWGEDSRGMGARAWGSFAILNPYSGEILSADYLPSHQAPSYTAINTIFSLHFVTFGGLVQKWVYFFLALAGAWLFYTGNLLWVESRRRSRKRNPLPPVQRRDAQWLANGTVGVCLGAVCGISATISGAKWLSGWAGDMILWHQAVYYGVFFLAIGWSFSVGAARASVQLLWLAALLTVSIPLTSFIGWLQLVPTWWGHTSMASLGVDITALVAALCFMVMARKTAERTQNGAADSVWHQYGNEDGAIMQATNTR